VDDLETRELRYFVAVASELHFGRAAASLGIAQPALSRAVQGIEQRLGVTLLDRNRRGVRLTSAGAVLLRESRPALEAVAAAARRTRRAGAPVQRLVLATKAGSSHELLQALLDANAADEGATPVEVVLCEIGEQAGLLRDGTADVAIMHRPFDDFEAVESIDLQTEAQVAIVPRSHPLADRASLTMDEVAHVPDLPIARWPQVDGSYLDGPGPEVHSQSQLAQLVALGRTLLVIPRSSRAWQWPEHVAVPVLDAPLATTTLSWPVGRETPAIARLARNALAVADRAVPAA
jgi:DNA-binding transcriptional LysR family regulator